MVDQIRRLGPAKPKLTLAIFAANCAAFFGSGELSACARAVLRLYMRTTVLEARGAQYIQGASR